MNPQDEKLSFAIHPDPHNALHVIIYPPADDVADLLIEAFKMQEKNIDLLYLADLKIGARRTQCNKAIFVWIKAPESKIILSDKSKGQLVARYIEQVINNALTYVVKEIRGMPQNDIQQEFPPKISGGGSGLPN